MMKKVKERREMRQVTLNENGPVLVDSRRWHVGFHSSWPTPIEICVHVPI